MYTYAEALSNLELTARVLGVTQRSTPQQIREAFGKAYLQKEGVPYPTNVYAIKVFEQGIVDFANDATVPGFVARHVQVALNEPSPP